MATTEEIKKAAILVRDATQIGENTAERVGGVLVDLANKSKELEDNIGKKADKEEMNRLLGTKANTADVNTKFTEEKKRVDTELAKKFDKESIAQESGEAEDKVMSQKAVSTKLSDLSSNLVSTNVGLEKASTNQNLYSDATPVVLVPAFQNYYIDKEGKFSSFNDYVVYKPIELKKGGVINVECAATDISVMSISDTDSITLDSALTPVVYALGDTHKSYTYKATKDCYIVISSRTGANAQKSSFGVKKTLRAAYSELDEKIDKIASDKSTSILYLNDEKTVGNYILQCTRPYNSNKGVLSHKLCTLGILTDIHGHQENLQRFTEFVAKYKSYTDDLLCLGDMVAASWADSMDFWNNVKGSEKILLTIGNHDTCLIGEGQDSIWDYYSGKQAYDRYFAPYIQNWNVSQPENANENGYCWYCKDYLESKVRLVVLDCMYIEKDTAKAQLSWFTNVLSDAKDKGLSVVAAKHYPFNVVQDKDNNTFNNLDTSPYWGNPKDSIKDFLDAINNFISGGGEFICWLNGDSHYDFQGTIEGYPNQYAIALENALLDSTWGDSVRLRGTKSQDSFNYVTFDTNSKLIKIVRVGNNSDRYLRAKNYICYDYKNKKIIACR